MKQYLVLLILGLAMSYAQYCTVELDEVNIYPTAQELYSLPLSTIFSGYNMSYSATDAPVTLYNYIEELSPSDLPSGTYQYSIYGQNEEWQQSIAVLAKQDSNILLYSDYITFTQSPTFLKGISLLQGLSQVTCDSMLFTTSTQVFVDCYTVNNGQMNNQWQIVDVSSTSSIPIVIPSSNNAEQKTSWEKVSRKIDYWNHESGKAYLYRAILSGGAENGSIDIFEIEEGFPQVNPIQRLIIQNLVNFQVLSDGTLYALDMNNGLYVYSYQNLESPYDDGALYLYEKGMIYTGFQIFYDYRAQVPYTLLITNTQPTNNVQEIYMTTEPQLAGYYNAQQLKFEGYPVQLDVTMNFVSVSQDGQTDFFLRNLVDLEAYDFKVLSQEVLFIEPTSMVSLNTVPEAIIGFGSSKCYLGLLGLPRLQGVFTTSNQVVITGTSTLDTQTAVCKTTVKYTLLQADDATIYQTTQQPILPNSVMFPQTYKINLNQYFSGPQLEATGQIQGGEEEEEQQPEEEEEQQPEEEEQQPEEEEQQPAEEQQLSEEEQQVEEPQERLRQLLDEAQLKYEKDSLFVTTTTQKVNIIVEGYQTSNSTYIKNIYNLYTGEVLQFQYDGSKKLYGYICENNELDQTNPVCFSLGFIEVEYAITNVQVVFQPIFSSESAYAFIVYPSSKTELTVQQMRWNLAEQKGNMTVSSSVIVFNYEGTEIPYTTFEAIGQKLYVVYQQFSTIRQYFINASASLLELEINASSFPSLKSFSPSQVLGDYNQFGPIIFINDGLQCLIVSVMNNKPQLLSTIEYNLQLISVQSKIALVGHTLIVGQTGGASSNQQSLVQYSLTNLYKPVKQKNIPLYSSVLKAPLQMYSDFNYLYVVTSTNLVLAYRLTESSHNCLIEQFDAVQEKVIFSSTGAGTASYVSYGDYNSFNNYVAQKNAQLSFIPGQYNNNYFTQLSYQLIVKNPLGGSLVTKSQNMEVFNPQVAIEVNSDALSKANTKFTTHKSKDTISISNDLLSKVVMGNVATYSLQCGEYCQNGTITLSNFLKKNDGFKTSLENIQSMTNTGLVQTLEGIYSVAQDGTATNRVTFISKFISCPILYQNSNQIVSICVPAQNEINIQVFNNKFETQKQFTLQNINNPKQLEIVGLNWFLQAIDTQLSSTAYALITFTYDQSSASQPFKRLPNTYTCSSQGINGFDIFELNTYNVDVTSYQQLVLFYTCVDQQLGVRYVSMIENQDNQTLSFNGVEQTYTTGQKYKYTLLSTTQFQQVKGLKSSGAEQTFIVTTQNLMSFIFKAEFITQDQATTAGSLAIKSTSVLSTIPPYGDWTLENSLNYDQATQQLVLSYHGATAEKKMIALYDLSSLAQLTEPFLMRGGYYPVENSVIAQAEGNIYVGGQLLSQVEVNSNLGINVNSKKTFSNLQVVVVPANAFTKNDFIVQMSYTTVSSSGMPWWGWLLIVIGIILVLGGIGFAVFKFKNKQKQDPLLA